MLDSPNYRQWLRNWPDPLTDPEEVIITWLSTCPQGGMVQVVRAAGLAPIVSVKKELLWHIVSVPGGEFITSRDLYALWAASRVPVGIQPCLTPDQIRILAISGPTRNPEADPSQLKISVGYNPEMRLVTLHFGMLLSYITLDPAQAVLMAEGLQKAAAELKATLN